MKTLADLMFEHEAELAEAARKQIAAEDAAWAALTPDQQQAHFDALAARMEALESAADNSSDEDDSEDDNED